MINQIQRVRSPLFWISLALAVKEARPSSNSGLYLAVNK